MFKSLQRWWKNKIQGYLSFKFIIKEEDLVEDLHYRNK